MTLPSRLTPASYCRAGIQFFQDIILYGFTTFLPSILKLDLQFTSLEAQYLSVPVYFLGGVSLFVCCTALHQADWSGFDGTNRVS